MAPLIPTLPLQDGHSIPAIGFGTGSALRDKDAYYYVVQALEGGFNHIDTAQIYHNEETVGIALQNVLGGKTEGSPYHGNMDIEKHAGKALRREDIWVTTKYYGAQGAEAALDASLEKLGLSYVDLYLIHHPRLVPDLLEAWAGLERAQEHGKARSIGVSNFNIEQLKLILKNGRAIPAVNQIELHPYNYHQHVELLQFANQHGIRIESYSGLAPITKLPGGRLDAVLTSIAKRLGPHVTPAQVIMSWLRAKDVVIVTTTSRKERVQEYLGIFELPPLRLEDVAAIDEAGRYPPSVATLTSYSVLGTRVPMFIVLVVVLSTIVLCRLATL